MTNNLCAMTHIYNDIVGIILGAAAVAALASCEYKDLDELDTRPQFALNVDYSYERVDSVPGAFRVAFYPADQSTFLNSEGYTFFDTYNTTSKVTLPAGRYNVVAWNNDTEHVLVDGYYSKTYLHATTQQRTPDNAGAFVSVVDSIYDGQQLLDYPDYMVHAMYDGVEVGKETEGQTITLHPDSMVVTVDVIVRGVAGLGWANEIRGTLNNLSGRRFIAQDNITEEPVALLFDCARHINDSTVTARFYAFGIQPLEGQVLPHKMVLLFWMSGSHVFLPVDVSPQVAKYSANDRHVVIEVPNLGIDLRDYIHTQGAFDLQVEDWPEEEIDIRV